MTATTARARAVANENRQIEASQQRAIAAREAEQTRPRNALEAMASRLEVSPAALKETLVKTVFSTCKSESEFIALVIVANAYGLNPLLKEIYAFPAKGGGVVPMVSVDGWIKLMHSHPAYDSIEFSDIADERGEIYAIEATIWRSDKTRPTKIIEYLDECKRNTDPWKQSPLRMLRHRALIQCARVAFGFSGLSAPEDTVIEGIAQPVDEVKVLPSTRTLADELDDEIPNFDKRGEQIDEQTGEVLQRDSRGMTEVDEETARQLDAGNDGTLAEDNPNAEEGPAQEQRGEQADDRPMWLVKLDELAARLDGCRNHVSVNAVEQDWLNIVRPGVPDGSPEIQTFERRIAQAKAEYPAPKRGR